MVPGSETYDREGEESPTYPASHKHTTDTHSATNTARLD